MGGTELIIPYDSLQEELDRAKHNLKGLNENIRRIIGRDPQDSRGGDRNNDRKRNFNDSSRRSDGDRSMINRRIEISPPPQKRRPQETKSVFSRLSGPPIRNNNSDFSYENYEVIKPRIYSRVIKELPTREEIVEAQGGDEQSRARNRRMFGCLLGTLQKFCQEESRLKTKEEKKAQIEKKLEEQELKERINMKKERQSLFIDRKKQQLEIRKLEMKMTLLREFNVWEKAKKDLNNFIKTKAKPPIYFKPKIMNEKSEKLLEKCRIDLKNEIEKKKTELNEQIIDIENRFKLREDEEALLADWEKREKLGEFQSRHYQKNNHNHRNNDKHSNYNDDDDEDDNDNDDDDDSSYDDDENEDVKDFENIKNLSKSVVITVKNDHPGESKENDCRNADGNIVIKTENEEKYE